MTNGQNMKIMFVDKFYLYIFRHPINMFIYNYYLAHIVNNYITTV